ncbi:MAG: DUF2252 family protein [Polyangiales bacterium]
MKLLRALLSLTIASVVGCASEDRDATIRSVFARADDTQRRARPTLLEGRYARMAASPVDFYRGSIALFLRDWRDGAMGLSASAFSVDAPMPLGVGDPHVENFGTLQGPDGRLTLEANDLDGADRVPYLWDLRRLTVGLCVAARASNADDASARALTAAASERIAFAAARAYADGFAAPAQGLAPESSASAPLVDDLFRRAQRDATRRSELSDLTAMTSSTRSLLRGALDPEDPTDVLGALPSWAVASLPALFASYRATLRHPPDARYFTVLDAARHFGSGVASFARVRLLVLVRGETDAPDDDVILEVKEQSDAVTPGGFAPYVWFDSNGARVLAARDALWSRPDADPRWGVATWFGLPVQIRTETAAAKGLRIARMTGANGTPEALVALARTLGARLAAMHRRTLPADAPHATVLRRDPDGFAREQAAVSTRYAAQVFADHARFAEMVRTLGPSLAIPAAPDDAPSSPARALFGSPLTP